MGKILISVLGGALKGDQKNIEIPEIQDTANSQAESAAQVKSFAMIILAVIVGGLGIVGLYNATK